MSVQYRTVIQMINNYFVAKFILYVIIASNQHSTSNSELLAEFKADNFIHLSQIKENKAMSIVLFTQELAQEYFDSTEQFPIDFNNAWVWLGYSNKANAKRQLIRFKEGLDFSSQLSKTTRGGRPSELIHLSVDCFKMLGMLAETEQGDTIRKYFLECERLAKQLLKEKSEQPKPLIPGDIRVVNFINTLKELGTDIQNPRFNQELQDFALDVAIGYNSREALPQNQPVYLGVAERAERAEQLGYQVSLVTNHRSQLGKYVKACGLASIKEKRLCNGTQREINLYELTDELDNAIKEFMDAKVLAA